MSILTVENLRKVYSTRFGGNQVEALKNVNFSVDEGEYVAIMGESGSGKTTLLNLLAALDKPTGGTIVLDGKELGRIKESDVATFRRDNLGFVFQEFNLLDTFTIQDNILLPLVLAGKSYDEMTSRLLPIAKDLGLTPLLKKYPYEVSGGQKQRAAVARALITNPRIILADEPTGALDSKSTDELLGLFEQINKKGQTILMVTHSVKAASRAQRILFIKDGEFSDKDGSSGWQYLSYESRAAEYADFAAVYGGLFFLGVTLSLVFICAAVLIIYYKQLSEGYEDAQRFEIMQKVGMTKQEIRRSINSQLLTVFFLPLIFAGLHLAFAFPFIRKILYMFSFYNTSFLVWTTVISFFVFAVLYALVYKKTSNTYYKIVS